MIWLDYFGEVYFSYIVKTLMMLLRGYTLQCKYSQAGKGMVAAGFSLTVSFPDLSVKLSTSLDITSSY